jgi:glycerophosphoryl diester phosphodiesterase
MTNCETSNAETMMKSVPPTVIAHRGLHHFEPENSLGAFIAAAESGFSWVECDVWPSCEGIPVVIHDETVDRTTAGSGLVGQQTHQALAELGVASLQELFSMLADYSTGILIEIKPPNAAEFCRAVERLARGYRGPWMVQSFHGENIKPTQQSALLVENHQQLRAAIDGHWPSIHAEHSLIDRAVVDALHRSGRKIGAWTVNDQSEIRRMVELGVDALITDEPELATQICRSAIVPSV